MELIFSTSIISTSIISTLIISTLIISTLIIFTSINSRLLLSTHLFCLKVKLINLHFLIYFYPRKFIFILFYLNFYYTKVMFNFCHVFMLNGQSIKFKYSLNLVHKNNTHHLHHNQYPLKCYTLFMKCISTEHHDYT